MATINLTKVRRIALNMDQVDQYSPPPNPAKITDSRARGYIARYGRSSWELDALDPVTIGDLIRAHVLEYRDERRWQNSTAAMEEERDVLAEVGRRWAEVSRYLEDNPR